MPSPKSRFLKTPQAKQHAELCPSPIMEQFFDWAMLQVQYDLGHSTDAGSAAACHLQMVGAQKLRDTFMNLSLPDQRPVLPNRDNLNPL